VSRVYTLSFDSNNYNRSSNNKETRIIQIARYYFYSTSYNSLARSYNSKIYNYTIL